MSKRLLIADAAALIFRGAAAIKHATNPEYPGGWSFLCRTVLTKIKETNATHVCIAGEGYQSSLPRKRKLLKYKVNRPPCDPHTKYQLGNVHKPLGFLSMKYVNEDYYEADDIINTYVKHALFVDFESIHIIAEDKDLYPLLNDNRVSIHRLSKKSKLNPVRIENPATDIINLPNIGVLPSQIPDFLALVGDSSDNIPGCPTIGPKRAKWLLDEYKSIDGIFENLAHIQTQKGAKNIALNLRNYRKDIELALSVIKLKDLCEEKHDYKIDFDYFRYNPIYDQPVTDNLLELHLESVVALINGTPDLSLIENVL